MVKLALSTFLWSTRVFKKSSWWRLLCRYMSSCNIYHCMLQKYLRKFLQVYVCRIWESQSCGFGSEETCSRQCFSLWTRDRPGLNKSFKGGPEHYYHYYFELPIIVVFGLIGLNLSIIIILKSNHYNFQVDWAEPEHEVDEETMSTVKVKISRIFFLISLKLHTLLLLVMEYILYLCKEKSHHPNISVSDPLC